MNGILFASFGTTHAPAREKQIDAVATSIATALPGYTVAQAYTSGIVRRVLEKKGIHIPDPGTALEQMAKDGITDVVIQPGHLLPGKEYEKLCHFAASCSNFFGRMRMAAPLLASTEDLHRLADILAATYPQQADTAVVLMGHGTPWFFNTAYAALDYRLKEIGRADVYVGTVETYPGLDVILTLLQQQAYTRVRLAPLMLVAGDHAINDMAGDDDDSWVSQLQSAGYQVECVLQGLGEVPSVQEMYVDHIRQALETEDGNGA